MIDEKNIKSQISLKEEYWEVYFGTNCYAFALGLDVPESEICKDAYELGIIGANKFNIPIKDILKLSFESRLLLDLKALKIAYKEIDKTEKAGFYYIGNYICRHWDIILFKEKNGNSFHFVRKNYNGVLYHKIGYFAQPMKLEKDKVLKEYEPIKKYRLRYWERDY